MLREILDASGVAYDEDKLLGIGTETPQQRTRHSAHSLPNTLSLSSGGRSVRRAVPAQSETCMALCTAEPTE